MSSHTCGDAMILSVRETRMIVERILLAAGLPIHFVPAVGNCVLYSHVMRLGGLAAFEKTVVAAGGLPAVRRTQEDPDDARLDAGGNHAWLVANDALDLALSAYRRGRPGAIRVTNVDANGELRVIAGLAGRHGARAEVALDDQGAVVRIVADRLPGQDAVMDEALRRGLPVPRPLWRILYDRSSAALTPDSIESRRHAGPVMVDAEGRVHGRDDDDTDFELLVGQPFKPSIEKVPEC